MYHLFTEQCHAYLIVGSMHAVIKKSAKNSIVWAPSEWPTILRNARKSKLPYNVKVVIYIDFKK